MLKRPPALSCLLFGLCAFAAPALAQLEDCDMPGHYRVLQAQADRDARSAEAVWLDADTLRWPAQSAEGDYVLYASAHAGLRVVDGQVQGDDQRFSLRVSETPFSDAQRRFAYLGQGVELETGLSAARMKSLHNGQLWLVREDAQSRALAITRIQHAPALDALYPSAAFAGDLGVHLGEGSTRFALWAPTATRVGVCMHARADDAAQEYMALGADSTSGLWRGSRGDALRGVYYTYLVDVFVPGFGVVRNRVTDPYSVSLSADSKRSFIADLDDAALKPAGWDSAPAPQRVKQATDMVIYELHVRDFSVSDATVDVGKRGKYAAFTQLESAGMRHLRALSQAGITDVHFLPVFDLATVPEKGCITPQIDARGDSPEAARIQAQTAAQDCFNWGYDPLHFNAPEGSYSSDADDGAARIRELRTMVQALHGIGLRVGMDVVYNHMSASGQDPRSVLDRIVPGYYHRLNAKGEVERSTCCDNTATEHRMMEKLMVDSAVLWAKHYRIDSFRFDLMGHQPRDAMLRLQREVDAAAGRRVDLIGEGWNFGEVANGARFVQASQLSLNGSGIGTFSDRARDAARGGRAGESGEALVRHQGYFNGLGVAPNGFDQASSRADRQQALRDAADQLRVGLAGSLRGFRMQDAGGTSRTLEQIRYGDQPAGYVSQPGEVVNYVENHDNHTLFDIHAFKLPLDTSADDRARMQLLALANVAFSQGIAYYHAGGEILRSKSMDGNSYDSGDWFNPLDWSLQDNHFARGLPPERDNGRSYAQIAPRLRDARLPPSPEQIRFTRDGFLDLLRIRASTGLLRLSDAEQIQQRLRFFNTGPEQIGSVLVGHLDGREGEGVMEGAGFAELVYFINVDTREHELRIPELAGKDFMLHPVQSAGEAADARVREDARYGKRRGEFRIPPRSAVVFVIEASP